LVGDLDSRRKDYRFERPKIADAVHTCESAWNIDPLGG
jgi:hypothetical protein